MLYNYEWYFYINHFSLIIFYHSVWLGFELFVSWCTCTHIEYSSLSCAEDMTITNVIIKTPDRQWDWGVNDVMPGSDRLRFLMILKKTLVEIWLWAGPVQLGGGLTVGDVGTVSIVKIVCLSLSSCRKTKVKKVINVSYLNNGESSVFRISAAPEYFTKRQFSILLITPLAHTHTHAHARLYIHITTIYSCHYLTW